MPPLQTILPQAGRRSAATPTSCRRWPFRGLLTLPAALAMMAALTANSSDALASRPGARSVDTQTARTAVARNPVRASPRPRAVARRAAAPTRSQAQARSTRSAPRATPPILQSSVVAPSVDPSILAMLHATARRIGADPVLLAAMAWRESRFDAEAQNPLSSARGLMQFTDAAWLEAVRDHGPTHGLVREAALVVTDPATGTVSAADPGELRRILDLRRDPQVSAALAAERALAVRPGLETSLRRRATAAELYAVHLLGQAGARRFYAALARRPSHSATSVVGQEVAARNRGVFFAVDGRALSLREVQAGFLRTAATGRALAAVAQRTMDAPVEVADAGQSSGRTR